MKLHTHSLMLRLVRFRLLRYLSAALMWGTWWALPAGVGLALGAIFDALAEPSASGSDVPLLIGLLLAVEFARVAIFWPAIFVFTRWWIDVMTWLRANLLHAQLASARVEAGAPITDPAAALPTFRDDVEDVVVYADTWLDLGGTVGFAVVALSVMATIDPLLTLVAVLPIAAVTVVNQLLARRIRATRLADREATERVTGFLGSVFGAALALKVAGAEERAVAQLRERNQGRSRTALRDRVLTDSLNAFSASTVHLSVGLVLLAVAGDMRSGDFTLGDLALFVSYLDALASLPRWIGTALLRHRHAQVGFQRMSALLPGGDPAGAVVHRPLRLTTQGATPRPRPPRVAPAELRVSGLATGVLEGVDLHLPAGSFTVVCGPVGSGKSTLLRALLGLTPLRSGEVSWDGRVIDDLAAHMTPPRAAYVGQVPRMFAGTLEENLTLGLETSSEQLAEALRIAALDSDVAALPEGLGTRVGTRGLRLSGGQLQRTATARALVATPALLVLDDLSSALDARTERLVWQRLREGSDCTCIVVSHRPAALERADQVVLLDGGRVVAAGTPAELRAQGLDPLAPALG